MEEKTDISSFTSYIFFWMGQLASIFGSSVVYFALTWWLTDITESAIVLSIGSLSYLIPFILASLMGGVVADKYDRKKSNIDSRFTSSIFNFYHVGAFYF